MESTRLLPASGVTVRMYNTGFGDCFLLAFARKGEERPFYMLIDCGAHGQYSGGADRTRDVAADIREATGGHLDVVVVTHEHTDHLSGFYSARKDFETFDVGEVWFAWTEDSENELAKKLDRKKALAFRGLSAARNRLEGLGADETAQALDHLLGFYQLEDGTSILGLADGMGISTRKTRALIGGLAKGAVRYLRPKQAPRQLPDVEGVRIFVLGPPEDEALLLAANPTGRPGEVYEHDETNDPDDALASALVMTSSDVYANDYDEFERAQPFAGNHRVPVGKVKANPKAYELFHETYGFAKGAPDEWRRIDESWLGASESLALKLDSATNNTSLVLAIELGRNGKVLLFPGDAQVGNWRSWHEGGWSEENGLEKGEEITAKDLLQRTVLYKVGHHGSHNATLREEGLELMTSDELTAMIPVDEDWARALKPHPWKMPFGPMYEDLMRRTQGRILRTDIGLAKPERPAAAWKKFEEDVDVIHDEDHPNKVHYVELNFRND